MIWTDWGSSPKIEKATLSGNQRVAIVTSNLHWPNGIELDRGNKRIYWVDRGVDRIESRGLSRKQQEFTAKGKRSSSIWCGHDTPIFVFH